MVTAYSDLLHHKFFLELLTIEIRSREAPLVGISMEVLSEEIGILTPFGPIHIFLGTFVGSKWECGGQFNISYELS